jgi:hypothetical protein
MSKNLEELKKEAEKIKMESDNDRSAIENIGRKLGLSQDEIEGMMNGKNPIDSSKFSEESKDDTRPVFNMPDDIDTEAGHFEKVNHDTDDEHEPTGDKESRKSLTELKKELEKLRLDYFKKAKDENKIKLLSKALLHKITKGKFKPDYINAKSTHDQKKQEYNGARYAEKAKALEEDLFKTKEEKERELADFKAGLSTETSVEIAQMDNFRAQALSEAKQELREKALKATIPLVATWKVVKGTYQTVGAIDKKLFHRGRILIDKRGEKPANADDLNRQAKVNDDQIEKLEIALKNEKIPEEKDRLKKEIKSLKDMSKELKDQAKGEIIYQYRLGQLVRSAALFAAGGGLVGGGAGVAMLGLKVVRSISIGILGASALAYNERALQSKLHEIKTSKEKLESEFAGRTREEDYVLGMEQLKKRELMTKIGRNAMKVVIAGFMIGANYASAYGENHLHDYVKEVYSTGDTVETTNTESTKTDPNENSGGTKTEENSEPTTEKVEEVIKTPEASDEMIKNVETIVSGEGSLATIDELKEKLSAQFQDPSQAPAHIRHIIETDKYTLGKEWGLFNPDDPSGKESAMMLKGSKITMDKNWNITLHNIGKGDTVLSGEGAKVYSGEMFNSNSQENGGVTKLGEGEVNIDEVSEEQEGYTKLGGEENIYQNKDGIDPNNPDKAPYADGLPVDKNELNKTVWEKGDIKIRSGAYEDANGNIVRLDGKEVTLGADHKIYVDGVVSEYLTDELNLEKDKLLDKTFGRMFGWSNDGAKSPEWRRLQNYNMDTLKNPPTEGFLSEREDNFIKKLLKVAQRNGVDYHGKTASQLVEAIAINELGK